MGQVHRRFSDEQVGFLLQAYPQGLITIVDVREALDIGKTRFFALCREYHWYPEAFAARYLHTSHKRMWPKAEAAFGKELLREKSLLDDLPIAHLELQLLGPARPP